MSEQFIEFFKLLDPFNTCLFWG